LGQSKRQFGTRLKLEHQKAVSTLDKGKSALAEHVCYAKHEIAWENSKVITTNNRYGQRLCLEAWHTGPCHLGVCGGCNTPKKVKKAGPTCGEGALACWNCKFFKNEGFLR
jgi:hypothetical protein